MLPFLRLCAGGLVMTDAMIHAALLKDHFTKALYMGILFGFAIFFLSMLALSLVYSPTSAERNPLNIMIRVAGIALMAGLMVGYFATRTIGFPGFQGQWGYIGITSLAIEAFVIALLAADGYVMLTRSARTADAKHSPVVARAYRR